MIFPTFFVLTLLAAGDALPRVSTQVTASKIVVATPLTLEVTASAPEGMPISPAWPPVIGAFEIVGSTERSSPLENGRRTRTWELRLITFTAGPAQIPPIEVVVEDVGRRARRMAASSPINVQVQAAPALTPDDPLRLPPNSARLPWTLLDGTIGATVFVVGLTWLIARRRRATVTETEAGPATPAPIVKPAPTIDDLRAALSRNAGQIDQFYELAIQVARGAIGNASGIASETLCSRELVGVVAARPGPQVDDWARWLQRIDRVRFGRINPPASEPAELVAALEKLLAIGSDWNRRR